MINLPIEHQIKNGVIQTKALTNNYGSIVKGSFSYSYFNHDGIYDNFNVGDEVYFFWCNRTIINSLPEPDPQNVLSSIFAFNIHNFTAQGSPSNYTINAANHREVPTNGDGTVSDIPPGKILKNGILENTRFIILDNGELHQVIEIANMNVWDRIKINKINELGNGMCLFEKINADVLTWKFQ